MGELIKEQAKKTVGQSIKILRIKNGWNQEYIANRLGISMPALYKIDTGVTDVNLSRLEQIANIYEVTLAQLVNICDCELEPIGRNGDTLRQKLREQETEIFA